MVHRAVEGQRLPDQLGVLISLLLDLEDVSHAESVKLFINRYLIHALLRLAAIEHPPDLDVLIHLRAGGKELLYGATCAHILGASLLWRLVDVGAPLDLRKFRPLLLMHLHGGTGRHNGQVTRLIVDH